LDAESVDSLPEEVPRGDLPEIGAMTMSPVDGMIMHDGNHDHARPRNRRTAYILQTLRIKGENRHLKTYGKQDTAISPLLPLLCGTPDLSRLVLGLAS
jgi:hypothetical protein